MEITQLSAEYKISKDDSEIKFIIDANGDHLSIYAPELKIEIETPLDGLKRVKDTISCIMDAVNYVESLIEKENVEEQPKEELEV